MNNLNQFLNKRVSVEINDRDFLGKKVWNKYTKVEGICTHIGFNTILNERQVNIGRSPFFIEDWSKVKLV